MQPRRHRLHHRERVERRVGEPKITDASIVPPGVVSPTRAMSARTAVANTPPAGAVRRQSSPRRGRSLRSMWSPGWLTAHLPA